MHETKGALRLVPWLTVHLRAMFAAAILSWRSYLIVDWNSTAACWVKLKQREIYAIKARYGLGVGSNEITFSVNVSMATLRQACD